MTVLHLLLDGALAAAELLALILVPPAAAAEPGSTTAPSAIERPMQLHRLSTVLDVRLLGALADVRVAQHLRNDGTTSADLGPQLPSVDEQVDVLRVVRAGRSVDLLGAPEDCGSAPAVGHVNLTDDEAIADALQITPGAEALVEIIATRPLIGSGRIYRVAMPAPLGGATPHARLVTQAEQWFLVVVPHRAAPTARLVLRPASGAAESFALGQVDPSVAIVVPLASRAHVDDLARGAIECELAPAESTFWPTLGPDRVAADVAVQAGTTE